MPPYIRQLLRKGCQRANIKWKPCFPVLMSKGCHLIQRPGNCQNSLTVRGTSRSLPPCPRLSTRRFRIEGSITKAGDTGVEMVVTGPDGFVFGPKKIDTKLRTPDGAGEFTQQVTVKQPGEYDVTFKDAKGYVGVKTFKVVAAVPPIQTTVPTTTVTPLPPITTLASSPMATQSPLSPLTIIAVLSITGLISVIIKNRRWFYSHFFDQGIRSCLRSVGDEQGLAGYIPFFKRMFYYLNILYSRLCQG